METLKNEIKILSKRQTILRDQRKTVYNKLERIIDPSKASYEHYENGMSYAECLNEISTLVTDNIQDIPQLSGEMFHDYEKLRPLLNLQVVSTETNAEMLRDIPHQEMEDLSVVYRFVLQSDEQGTQSILITNHLLDVYGITAEQLHNDALKAAPINSPIEIAGMNEVIKEIMGSETLDDLEIPKEEVMYSKHECLYQKNGTGRILCQS